MRAVRPDLVVRPIRGNVDTRLRKFDAGEYRCLILAAAGLERLGLGHRITGLLSPPEFWPAVGQGALALQVRSDDAVTRAAITPLDDPASHAAVVAERACLAELSAGCLAPVGGWGRSDDTGRLVLAARVLEEHAGGVRHLTETAEVSLNAGDRIQAGEGGEKSVAVALGQRVAALLLTAGAGPMLVRMRQPMG